MCKSEKQKMATIWEIYNRIIWDSRLDNSVFIAGFQDRISLSGIREKPLVYWAVDGDIPWHRIRYIRCKDVIVWDREKHLDLISTGHLPDFAWKNNQANDNVLNMKVKPTIFKERPVYKYENQDWQPVDNLSISVKSNSLTIASFNVLNNLFKQEEIQTEKRLPAIVEHLRQCDADIIAIQEATPALLECLLSQDWVRNYYISESISAQTIQTFGNLLLSRLPFTLVEHKFSAHKQVLVGSWFINNELLQVAVVHLTSNRAQNAAEKRKNQLTTLLQYLQEKSGNCLIVGDFNTRENQQEILTNSNFIDIWQELHPNENGYTFDPQRNPLAELMSLQGEAGRLDRILLRCQNHNWVPQSVDLFACEPIANTQGNIFPSDHFGIRAVISNRKQENLTPSLGTPLDLLKRGEGGEVSSKISPVYRSAIAIIPPDNVLPTIQAIRQLYDARFERWMPHINLIYGFLPESYFDEASSIIASAVAQIQPFTITLNNFETFTHRRNSIAWLRPIAQPETALHELQELLESLFPQCNEQSRKSEVGFTPHLSVGQFSSAEEAFTKLPQWHPISFAVKSIALISRRGDEPFEVRKMINLGGETTTSVSPEFINLVNQLEPLLNQTQQTQRDIVLEVVAQACKECLGFEVTLNLLGSHRLGVQSSQSDVDVVCQIPTYLSGETFLKRVQQRLTGLCESIQLVLNAKVPVLRLKLEGVSIDLLYARIDGNWELSSRSAWEEIRHGVSEINLKSQMAIIGCWEADFISEFVREYVPFDSFSLLLRAVKGWAKSRRIYGNAWGFIGGFSWALLSAWSCQYTDNENTHPDKLFANFFQLLNQHDWNQPIALTNAGKQYCVELPRDLLPIITSIEPCQNTARNVTCSTVEILHREFTRGVEFTQEIIAGNRSWVSLFEGINLQQESDIFLVLTSTNDDNQKLEIDCGILEGSIISLIITLEHNGIFVRPWTGIDRNQNFARVILGLNLPLNFNFSTLEELAQDFVSQFINDFEIKVIDDF